MSTNSSKGNFLDSLLDAFRLSNIFLKLLMFLVFGLITATPYLIRNLDKVAGKVAGGEGHVVWLYLKAIFGATWKGFFIGTSTLFDATIHFGQYVDQRMIGTLFFAVIVLIFGTLTLYQPIRLLFNILDMKKGREHSRSLIVLISVVTLLIIVAPLSHLVTGGGTITSGIEDVSDDESLETGDLDGLNESVVDVPLNSSLDEELVNTISLL